MVIYKDGGILPSSLLFAIMAKGLICTKKGVIGKITPILSEDAYP